MNTFKSRCVKRLFPSVSEYNIYRCVATGFRMVEFSADRRWSLVPESGDSARFGGLLHLRVSGKAITQLQNMVSPTCSKEMYNSITCP